MRRKYIVFLLLFVLAGCGDHGGSFTEEKEEEKTYPVSTYMSMEVSEVLKSDAQTVTSIQTYIYDEDGRLSGYTTRQTTQGVGAISIECTTTVSYDGQTAVVTDGAGNVLTYTLVDGGRATSCLYSPVSGDERYYTFSYYKADSSESYYLEHVSETLGDASEPYSEISIDYTRPEALVVTSRVDGGEQSFLLTFPSGKSIANIARLPSLPLTELYPLTLHTVALYGQLLGDAYEVLQTSCVPTDNAESEEVTSYTYDTDADGFPKQCHIVTQSYGDTYQRTLDYSFGW